MPQRADTDADRADIPCAVAIGTLRCFVSDVEDLEVGVERSRPR